MARTLRAQLMRPKHLAATAAIFVVLGGLGFGILGNASANETSESAPPVPPAEIGFIPIPEPSEGDRGRYELHKEAAPAGTSTRYGGISWGNKAPIDFAWGADRIVRNATGALHWTNVLQTSQWYIDRWDNATEFVYAGTLRSLGTENQQIRLEAGPSNPALPLPLLPPGNAASNTTYRVTFFNDGWTLFPCGVRNGFQGSGILLTPEPQEIEPGCPFLGSLEHRSRLVVEGSGGPIGERDVRVRVQRVNSDLPEGWMWFRENTPYPLRVEIPATEDGMPVLWVFELTGLDRGSTPLRMLDEPSQGLPALELRPRPQWTMDDEGVEHPFPLSNAFVRARDDDSYAALGDFLERHPDSYVASARYAAFDMAERQTLRWDFVATDGTAHLGVSAMRITEPSRILGIPVPGDNTTTYAFEETDNTIFDVNAGYLTPQELPPALPSAASLLERWRHYASAPYVELGAEAWGFYIAREPDGPGGEPGLYIEAGRVHFTRTAGPVYPVLPVTDYTDTWSTSTIGMYDQWERVDRIDEVEDSTAYSAFQEPAAAAPPLVPQDLEKPGASPAPLIAIAGFWQLPTGPVAAGVGAAAFIASVLYYVWPALKTGGLGLFSRIRGEELLDNPIRARMMQAIEAQPGLHHQDLVRLVGKGNGTVEHHLAKLVQAGRVVRHKSAGYACYFVKGQVDRRVMAAAPVLKSKVARALLETARLHPGSSLAAVARAEGVAVPTVHYHLRRLQAAGLIRFDGGLHATPDGVAVAS